MYRLLIVIMFSQTVWAQNYPELNFKQFEQKFMHPVDDSIYVFNFWATWCKPCVQELEYFESVAKDLHPAKYKFILVSLDDPKKNLKKIKQVLRQKNISLSNIILDDVKYNDWLPRVDPNWSGAIPATLVIWQNKRIFAERSFADKQSLFSFVNQIKI